MNEDFDEGPSGGRGHDYKSGGGHDHDGGSGYAPDGGRGHAPNVLLGPKSAGYARALRRWAPFLLHEPNALFSGSLWFLLTSLPIVTLGPAWTALHYYMAAREAGIHRTWRDASRFAFRGCGARAWLMGLSDAAAFAMAGGSLIAVFGAPGGAPEFGMPVRMLYAIFFTIDVLYLLSGIYRYPALGAAPETETPHVATVTATPGAAPETETPCDTSTSGSPCDSFITDTPCDSSTSETLRAASAAEKTNAEFPITVSRLAARGFLLALGNPGWTLMFAFAALLAFILCALTGVGILILFPAASAALSVCAYDELKAYYD